MEFGDKRRPDGTGGPGAPVQVILEMAGVSVPSPATTQESIAPDGETNEVGVLEGRGPVVETSADEAARITAEAAEGPIALRALRNSAARLLVDPNAPDELKSGVMELLAWTVQLHEERELEAERVSERIFHLQRDSLTKALRLDGFIDLLRNTEEGAEILVEIEASRVGIKHMDGRGVKLINDERGYPAGSRYLAMDANNLHEEAVVLRRSGPRRSDESATWPDQEDRRESTDRRRSHTIRDVIIRLGGDEFIILEIGAEPEDTMTTAAEMKALLSPEAAIARVKRGGIPFTSSVSWAHLTQVVDSGGRVAAEHRQAVEQQYEVYADAPEVIIKLLAGINLASQKQDIEKAEQYDQMLKLIEETLAARNEEMPVIQTDPRMIAKTFFEVCCDDWLNKWPR